MAHVHVPARRVGAALAVTVLAAGAELAGSWTGQSLFLAADAGHLLAHTGIFAVLLIPPGWWHERGEDVATIAVLVLVLAVAVAMARTSIQDLGVPRPEPPAPSVMLLSLLGLGANLTTAYLFADPARQRWSFHAGPPAGELLYHRYCASCHGLRGHGDGPVAEALDPRPADLTRLQSKTPELMRQIDGRRTIRAHGTAAMPVWGEVFEQSLIREPHKRRTALLQVKGLAEYVYGLGREKSEERR